ncbi:unnamed protein product [Owenia fusiformis]|uniref:Uncharacterized protein n=1 Tax=Owenia fusiformis TaxID=6347 RepID=A0A8S4Q444_OWEFU|nr:unnamed protein product [Owenia fusiformis]CAH1801294.1 unnamed protein product [Owenia fusiformis]
MDVLNKRSNRKFIIAGVVCCLVTLTLLTLMTRLGGTCQIHHSPVPPYLDKTAQIKHPRKMDENKIEVDELLQKIRVISDKIRQLEHKIEPSDQELDASNTTNWNNNWDKMENINRTVLYKTHITLVVGGESKGGQITPKGLRQMSQTAVAIRDIYQQRTVRIIHAEDHSSKRSAIEISRVTHGVISQDSLLDGGYPGTPDPVVNETALPLMDIRGYVEFRDSARLEAGFRRFIHHGEKMEYGTVLVAPEVVVKYFILRSLQLPVSMWQRLSLETGSISTIRVEVHHGVLVSAIGSIGHLTKE